MPSSGELGDLGIYARMTLVTRSIRKYQVHCLSVQAIQVLPVGKTQAHYVPVKYTDRFNSTV